MIKNNPQTQSCHALIIRLQEPYAEELATDLKSILDTIGWTYEERFASSTIGKEITIGAVDPHNSGVPMTEGLRCANAFWSSMSGGSIKARNGKNQEISNGIGRPTHQSILSNVDRNVSKSMPATRPPQTERPDLWS
jgi:hypothetical protein